MIKSLLSKLPTPKPADWGYKVSVCIAIVHQTSDGNDKIIVVTDNRVSFEDFSGEYLSLKADVIVSGWGVIYAGNDVEHAPPIIESSRRIAAKAIKKYKRELEGHEIAAIVDEAYLEHLHRHIESKLLRKHKFTLESFQKTGRIKCTPEVYVKVWDRIDRERISLQFLVQGFDHKREGHLWLVDGENTPVSYDSIGFWSIGKGASAALSTIAFYLGQERWTKSVEQAAYIALTAKFIAETASDVGPSTFAAILSHPSRKPSIAVIPDADITKIRELWKQFGVPHIPEVATKQIKETVKIIMHESESDSQKLKDQK